MVQFKNIMKSNEGIGSLNCRVWFSQKPCPIDLMLIRKSSRNFFFVRQYLTISKNKILINRNSVLRQYKCLNAVFCLFIALS
jgi:hypothetical protein